MDDTHSYWHVQKWLRFEFLKVSHLSSSFCQLISSYASLCAVELEVNEEITCKKQNHSFMSKKYTSQNNKNELWKFVRLTSFQKPTILMHFNLLQVCPSVLTFVKFAVLVITFFKCFECLFLCFIQFGFSFYC